MESRRSGAGSVVTARTMPPASISGRRVGGRSRRSERGGGARVLDGHDGVATHHVAAGIRGDDDAPGARLVDRQCRHVRDVLHTGWLHGRRDNRWADRGAIHGRQLDARAKVRVGEPDSVHRQREDDRPGGAGPDRRRDDLDAEWSACLRQRCGGRRLGGRRPVRRTRFRGWSRDGGGRRDGRRCAHFTSYRGHDVGSGAEREAGTQQTGSVDEKDVGRVRHPVAPVGRDVLPSVRDAPAGRGRGDLRGRSCHRSKAGGHVSDELVEPRRRVALGVDGHEHRAGRGSEWCHRLTDRADRRRADVLAMRVAEEHERVHVASGPE